MDGGGGGSSVGAGGGVFKDVGGGSGGGGGIVGTVDLPDCGAGAVSRHGKLIYTCK